MEKSAAAQPIRAQHSTQREPTPGWCLITELKSTGVPGVSACPLKMSVTSGLNCAKGERTLLRSHRFISCHRGGRFVQADDLIHEER